MLFVGQVGVLILDDASQPLLLLCHAIMLQLCTSGL